MAINEINNKTDGIFDDILPDVHVRYGVRDSLHTFQNSVLAAIDLTQNQFLPNGVDAVIGAGDNSVTEALAAILEKTNTPQISYGSGATELSHSDLYPTHLRVYPSDAYQGTAMMDIMAKTLKFKRMLSLNHLVILLMTLYLELITSNFLFSRQHFSSYFHSLYSN